MALEVSECPVVADDFESVVGAFERAARSMTAIVAIADVGRHHHSTLVETHRGYEAARALVRDRGVSKDDRFENPLLARRVIGHESHVLPHRLVVTLEVTEQGSGRGASIGEVLRPRESAFGDV